MGATLMPTVNPSLTHVVASADGSEKIAQARRIPGCYIVTSSWLMESLWSLTRRREMDYLLGSPPLPVAAFATLATTSPGVNGAIADTSNSTEEEIEDDDFADNLWDQDDS